MQHRLAQIDRVLTRLLALLGLLGLSGALLGVVGHWVLRQLLDEKVLPAGMEFAAWLAAIGCVACAGLTGHLTPGQASGSAARVASPICTLGVLGLIAWPAIMLDWSAARSPFTESMSLALPLSILLGVAVLILARALLRVLAFRHAGQPAGQ